MIKLVIFIGVLMAVNCVTIEQAKQNPLQAYVLTDQNGQVVPDSGVRLGPLDFSYTNQNLLEKYGLSQNLIQKFTPYFGLSGERAATVLQQNPLSITQQEFNEIGDKFLAYWAPKAKKAPAFIKSNPATNEIINLAQNRDWVDLLQRVNQIRAELMRVGQAS